jgi:hypothetical protein
MSWLNSYGYKKSFSQLGQDLFALETNNGKKGYFLDIGANDPIELNNTYLLEKNGWDGYSVDAFPVGNWSTRKTPIAKECLHKKNTACTFTLGGVYSGITDNLGTNYGEKLKDHNKVTVNTITPTDFLLKYNIPKKIDFLSIDVEGSELMILSAFPFDKYFVKLICAEHNFEEPNKTKVKELLESKGFRWLRDNKWDSYYINSDLST